MKFDKVGFDDGIRNSKDDTGYFIYGPNIFFELFILEAKRRTIWIGITYARSELWIEEIFVENDRAIVINRIRNKIK